MRASLLTSVAASLVLGTGNAQLPGEAADTLVGTPLPGVQAGTESWIIHFKSRPFDLLAFRAEMYGKRNPEVIATIVKDLESKVKAHQKDFAEDVVALGGSVTHQWWLINACCIEVAPKHLATLRAMPNVARLEPNIETFPRLKTATDSGNHNSDLVNSRGDTGMGVACAIIDTGQDENMNGSGNPHVVYSRNGSATVTRLVHNVKLGAMPADDVNGHGTRNASVAAGWKWNNAAADNGHAFDANIVGYSIANDKYGQSSAALEAAGYQNAAADAALYTIVTTNLSYTGAPSVVGAAALAQDSAALNADLLNTTGAGLNSLTYALPNVNGLSVGAVAGNSHTLATFSVYGIQDGRLVPNCCANGVAMIMPLVDNEFANYTGSGTSYASSNACGTATLIRATNRALRADETRAILLASTEKNPGSGAGMNSTGTGCGYLRDDLAHGVATTASLHGRSSLSATTTAWRRGIHVTKGKTVQIAIAWNRLDLTSTGTTWSNLDLALKRGATTLASSNTTRNTEEFFRFVPSVTETLIVEVTLVGNVIGGSAQPFGWATYFDGAVTKVPGTYLLYGAGCKGTGLRPGVGPVVPKGYASTAGNTLNSLTWGSDTHFMQAYGAAEFPAGTAIVRGLAFRNRLNFVQIADALNVVVRVGYSINPARALNGTFASNWSGTPATAFSGVLNVPAFAAQTVPTVWTLRVPFSAPFVYDPMAGDFLWERVNSTPSQPTKNLFDAYYSAATQACIVYSRPSTTTAGLPVPGLAIIAQLYGMGVPGATVHLTHTGVPEINASFDVKLDGAAQNTVAILWLGATQLNKALGSIAPGCTLYTSLDVFLGGVATGSSGSGAMTLGIPNTIALIGLSFSNQWIVFDGGANTLGLTMSGGGRATIGG